MWLIRDSRGLYWSGRLDPRDAWVAKPLDAKVFVSEPDAWHAGMIAQLTKQVDWSPVTDPQQEGK